MRLGHLCHGLLGTGTEKNERADPINLTHAGWAGRIQVSRFDWHGHAPSPPLATRASASQWHTQGAEWIDWIDRSAKLIFF